MSHNPVHYPIMLSSIPFAMNRFSVLMQDEGSRNAAPVKAKKLKFKTKNSLTWGEFFDMCEETNKATKKKPASSTRMGLRERARRNRERIMHPKLSGKPIRIEKKKLLVPQFEFKLAEFPALRPVVSTTQDCTWTMNDLTEVMKTTEWQSIPDPMKVIEEELMEKHLVEMERRKLVALTSMLKNATMSDKEYTYMLNMTDSYNNEFQPILEEVEEEARMIENEIMCTDVQESRVQEDAELDWNVLEEEEYSDVEQEEEVKASQWDCFDDDWA